MSTHSQQDLDFLFRRRLAIQGHETQLALDNVNFVLPSDSGPGGLKLSFIAKTDGSRNSTPVGLTSANIQLETLDGQPVSQMRIDALLDPVGNSLTASVTLLAETLLADLGGQPIRLRLNNVPNLDPFFSEVIFRIDTNTAPGLDPLLPPALKDAEAPGQGSNYLARDFHGFRQLLLDRMAVTLPEWKERNPADLGMVLVELLADVGDRLSYQQDAVATEAYLGTARQRVSVRRHARLLDYPMHEGCNARTWVHLAVNTQITIAPGTVFLTAPRTAGRNRTCSIFMAGVLSASCSSRARREQPCLEAHWDWLEATC